MKSNCLFEALKAKIKNPKIKILKMPKAISNCNHWIWKDEEFYYHSAIVGKTTIFNYLWHETKLKKIPKEIFESFVIDAIADFDVLEKKNILKKLSLNFKESKWDWSLTEFNYDNLPSIEENEKFEKSIRSKAVYKVNIEGKVEFVNYKELLKLKDTKKNFLWKLVDIFDNDFWAIYYFRKSVKKEELE